MDLSFKHQSKLGRDQSGSPVSDLPREKVNKDSGGRRRSNSKLGRLLLFVIFGVLAVTYLAGGRFVSQEPEYYLATAFCYCAPLWVGALMLGIWFRQTWAQVILSGLLLVSMLGAIGAFGALAVRDPRPPKYVLVGLVLYGIIQLLCAVVLIKSRDVRRLTSKSHQN